MQTNEHLRYPIGPFKAAEHYSTADIQQLLESFRSLPVQYAQRCQKIDIKQAWEKTYRPDSWTARQVAHHLADSHLNAYQRFKHTLTEDAPVLRGYDEQSWALLADNQLSYFVSQKLLEGIHERIYQTLIQQDEAAWARPCVHPSMSTVTNLATLLASYDWHGQHHLAHLDIIINA